MVVHVDGRAWDYVHTSHVTEFLALSCDARPEVSSAVSTSSARLPPNDATMCRAELPNYMYSTVQHSGVQYSTVQHSTAQYSTVQHSAVQYSTVEYSTVQHSIALLTVSSDHAHEHEVAALTEAVHVTPTVTVHDLLIISPHLTSPHLDRKSVV